MNNFQELLQKKINSVGKSIHDVRTGQGMTLDDLAFISNIEPANLSRIENGKRDPKLSTLLRIATALRLDLSALFIPESEPDNDIDNTNIFALFAKGMHFPCVIIETVIESTTNDRIREISTMNHKKYQSWGSEIDELSPPQKEQTQNLLSGVTDENASLMVIEARLNETRQCPHCKASGAVSKGMNRGLRRYLCKDCNKTFNAATGTALQGLHNKDKCLTFGNCLTEGMMVRKAAEHCDFAVSTSFRWRHRF